MGLVEAVLKGLVRVVLGISLLVGGGQLQALTTTVTGFAAESGEVAVAYNHRDRLIDWRLDGELAQSFAYDQIGNIESFAGVSYSYGSAHPHAVSSTSSGGSFGYNTAGYMTSRRDVTGAPTYSYLWWGNHKLRRVTSNAGNDAVWFYYGPDDERVRQLRQTPNASGRNYNTWSVFPFYQVEKGCFRADVDCDGDVDVLDIQKVASRFNTTYTAYEQDGTNPITAVDVTLVAEKWLWEEAGSAQQVVKTYWLGGRTVAIRRSGELTYLFQDHLGSPALETDVNGDVVASHRY